MTKDRSFAILWAGQAVSDLGSAVTSIALPLLAVIALRASPAQVGALQAAAGAAVMVVTLPAGVLVDRVSGRAVMIVCDVGRAVLLSSIPVAAAVGALALAQLYVVASVSAGLTVMFGLAHHSFYPRLLDDDQLVGGNSRIAWTESAARVAGPACGALAVGVFGAARVMVLDAASYLISASSLILVTAPAAPAADRMPRAELRSAAIGIQILRGDNMLRRLTLCTIGSMVSLGLTSAVIVPFVVIDLRQSVAMLGVIFAVGEIGGVVAASATSGLTARLGLTRLIRSIAALSPAGVLAAVATPSNAIVLITGFVALSAFRFVVFDVIQYSCRARRCPPEALGRLNALIRCGVGGATAFGAMLGGLLADSMGYQLTFVVSAVILAAASLPVIRIAAAGDN